MVMTLIPIVGFILYLLLGQDYKKRKMFKLKEEEDYFLSSITNYQANFMEKGKFLGNNEKTKDYYDLIKLNLNSDESFYTDDNKIDIFFQGKTKFESLLNDIDNAESSIDIQYYIFKSDLIGSELIRRLEKKQEEGVKVRLLYDGVGGRFLKKHDLDKLKELGADVEVFFPNLIRRFNLRLNYRNHRKLVIIDNKIGYIGGFNVGDEYLGLDKNFGFWRDTHIRVEGSAVAGIKFRFLKDFNYASKKTDPRAESFSRPSKTAGNSGIQIITSGPDTKYENIKNMMFKMITSAKDRVVIQTPYFIPDDTILDAIKTASVSGVDVSIMIPKNPDHPFVLWASLSYLGEVIASGAKAYLYDEGFMHCKMLLVDEYLSTIGSANMDIRSFSLNFESNALIFDDDVNQKLYNQFLEDVKNSEELTLEKYESRNKLVKIKESFSRLLSPIL